MRDISPEELDELKSIVSQIDDDVKSLIRLVAEHEVRLNDIRPHVRSCPRCGSRLMRNDDVCHVCS